MRKEIPGRNIIKQGSASALKIISTTAAVLLAFACALAPAGAQTLGNVEFSNYAYTGGDYAAIDRAAKSVFYVEEYSADYKAFATGSGFIMFDERLFVTNQHVIENASYLLIVDDDGRQYILDQVIISDKEHDIAILLFPDGKNYRPLSYDTAFDQLVRGQPVLTIGSPKGLPGTVSDGIISAFPKFKDEDIRRIQITAPISHGSSGGCLLNEDLKVIGVTSSGVDGGENLGFAIPIFIVEQLYQQWNKRDVVQLGTADSWDTVGRGLHSKVTGAVEKPKPHTALPGQTAPMKPPATDVTLPPVLSVAVSAENGFNWISWNTLTGAAKYEVYRDGSLIVTTKLNRCEDRAITAGKDYQYQVNAVLTSGAIIPSENITVKASVFPQNTKISAGDIVTFGTYPQTEAGKDRTPIEWQVLDVQENKALLLSRYGLNAKPYNTTCTHITWEKCTLRTWLNKDFLSEAFSTKEQTAILTTNVDNGNSNNTLDKIFLLSYAEAYKYLGVNDKSGITKSRVTPTAYAKKNGAYINSSAKTAEGSAAGWWWLRSIRGYQYTAAYVRTGGSLDFNVVNYDNGCVRPALWINLDLVVF